MTFHRLSGFFTIGLALILCSCAPVTIDSLPSGAEVYNASGKKLLGTTPYQTKLFLLPKQVVVRKDRYFQERVNLNADAPEAIHLRLRNEPVLVYAAPTAEIYLAGKRIGRTPMKVNVSSENQTYTLRTDGYYDKELVLGQDAEDPTIVRLDRRPLVVISATPDGVDLYENGQRLGSVPRQEEILNKRTFELRKDGYFPQTMTLVGAPPYAVSADLKQFPLITVKASPAGAKIYQGSKLLGSGTVSLRVGESTGLEVRADRFYSQNVTLTPESAGTVSVDLKPMPYVMIKSVPSGATVVSRGKTLGTTPLEQLVEKSTPIDLTKEGYQTASTTLSGKDDSVTIRLEEVPPPQTESMTNAPAGSAAASDSTPSAEKKSFWQKLFGK